MKSQPFDVSTLGKFLARTHPGDEIVLSSWLKLIDDIINLACETSAFIVVHGDDGAGKTTFLKLLHNKALKFADIVPMTPASPNIEQGWLMEVVGQWLSSDAGNKTDIHRRLQALAEIKKPIIISIDSGDLISATTLCGDIVALLNLCDTLDVHLSVVFVCGPATASEIASNAKLANKMTFATSLPHFSDNELQELLKIKLKYAGIMDSRAIENQSQFIVEANGSPMKLLKIVSAQFSAFAGIISQNGAPESKRVKASKLKKSESEPNKKSPIDDLLVPHKF